MHELPILGGSCVRLAEMLTRLVSAKIRLSLQSLRAGKDSIGMKPDQGALISFSRSHKIMAFALCCTFILLVALHIHQYSLHMWTNYTQEYKPGGVLFGTPQDIRSDDWAAEIPLMLSQISHKPPFPVINGNIGYGVNQLAPFKAPVWHILTLFKPTTWGFFLGADTGVAWMWWSMVLGLFYSFFLLFMLLSRNRFFLSVAGSLLLVFSPFFQFWSMHGSEIPMFTAFALVSLAHLMFSSGKRVVIASGIFLGWSCGCLMMNFIYPPFQVSLAYLALFITCGLVLERYPELDLRRAGAVRAAALVLSLAIALFAAGVFYHAARDVINSISQTVYPGNRFSNGGDFAPWKLFSNDYLIHLFLFFEYGTQAPSEAVWAGVDNISEYASFIFLFPFLISLFAMRTVRSRKVTDPLCAAVSIYIAVLLVYMIVGFPDWLGKASVFNRIPAPRQLLGLGIADVTLLVVMSSRAVYSETQPMPRFLLATAWATLLVLAALHLFGKWPAAPLPHLIAASVAIALISYFLFSARYSKIALTAFVLLSIVSSTWFNPVVRGGATILSDSTLGRAILDIDAREGGATRWVAFAQAPAMSNIFRILGVNSLSGTYPYPQLEIWRKLDPSQKALGVYNRYGYAAFVPRYDPGVAFSLVGKDSFVVEVNPESDTLRQLGVTHCLVVGMDTTFFDWSPALELIYSFRNSYIYKVVDAQSKSVISPGDFPQ